MRLSPTSRFRSSVVPALLGSIAIALLTLIAYRLHPDVASVALLYVLVVVMVSLRGELVASIWVMVLAVLSLDYFFTRPFLGFWPISEPLDAVALVTFLITALVINRLIFRMRQSLRDVEQADEASRKQALLLDLTHDTIFVRDTSDAIAYWNRGAETLYGWSRNEAVGKISHQLMQTIFPAPLDEINETLHRTGRWEGDLVHTKRDGTSVIVASRWSLQRDELGRPAAILETNNDVTEHKRAEAELRDHAQLLDLTHDTVFVRDMGDIITFWNRGAETLYGWSRNEVVGKISHQLMQTIFPAPLEEINEELLRTGHWEGELVHTKRDGSQVVVASRWSLQQDKSGRPVAILETNNDVTERKRAQVDLRDSEEQWKAVFEHNPTMYFMVSADGMILSVNSYGAEQLGYTIVELVGQSVLNVFVEADRQAAQKNVALCLEQLGQTMRWEQRMARKDGTAIWVRETAKAMVIKNHLVALIVCEDITERKRAERALRRAREHALEAQFAAVLEERTRLAREMHDTLLQGFTGIGLKLVAAASRVPGPPETTAALNDVITVAQRTLTDARRAVWGLRAATLTGNDFSAGLRTAAEDCVRGTRLELEYDVQGPPRPVDPDIEAVVVRVVQEAITNVIKHADARTVRVKLSFGARRIRLSVRDDGRGFAVAADFHAYDGHWGLLGMRERASQVHGKFSVRSTPDHGTHLVLLVPYAPAVVDPLV